MPISAVIGCSDNVDSDNESKRMLYEKFFVHVDPVDDALCSDDEPIFVSLESLDPGQIVYTVNLTCARSSS